MTTYSSQWHDGNCAVTRGFICEVPAGMDPPTTAPAPTLPPKIPCSTEDDTWIRMPGNDDYCYKFFSSQDMYTYIGKTWSKAEANCTAMGAHLASIHDIKENDFIMAEVRNPTTKNLFDFPISLMESVKKMVGLDLTD